MTKSLRQAAGSLLVVGLAGKELSAMERAWLRLIRPAGIILYRRNIANAAQTRALLDEATALCTPNRVRFVDVEGGTVNRLGEALAPLRGRVVIATKFGFKPGPVAGARWTELDSRPDHIKQVVEAFARLGVHGLTTSP